MILLDNSEYMRNGDYVPTRLEAQHDAANFLVGTKTQSNPENTVGVIAMCGARSDQNDNPSSSGSGSAGELLVSPTDDMGKILSALHGIPIRKGHSSSSSSSSSTTSFSFEESKAMDMVGKGGGVDLVVSLQIANLALKHRRNKNGGQRVIVFVGSPLTHVDARALVKAGRMLKKNNLAIDVIAMGELEENEPKLKELVDAANGSSSSSDDAALMDRTCHLVTIPSGVLPSDVLVSSPIVHGHSGMEAHAGSSDGISAGGGGAGAGPGGSGFSEFGGVDPNMDPELAMALRVSMEEERARQERATAAAAASAQENENTSTSNNNADGSPMDIDPVEGGVATNTTTATTSSSSNVNRTETDEDNMEVSGEDALLQQALAMSMTSGNDKKNDSSTTKSSTTASTTAPPTTNTDDALIDEEDEDAAMQLALQMSMQPDDDKEEVTAKKPSASNTNNTEGQQQQQFQDPQFVNQLLGSLPGVDSNDPELNSALRNMLEKKDNDDDMKEKDDK